jgi:hypothetical protein
MLRDFKQQEAADRFCREYVMNSAASSAADPVITNTSQQSADAVTSSSTPASRWASRRSLDQSFQSAHSPARAVQRDRSPSLIEGVSFSGHQASPGRTGAGRASGFWGGPLRPDQLAHRLFDRHEYTIRANRLDQTRAVGLHLRPFIR